MSRLLTTALLLPVVLFLAACGKSEDPAPSADASASQTQTATESPESGQPATTLKERAESGDPDAAYEYGSEFEKAGDADTAFLWFKRAAREQHVDASYKVGSYYHKGIATEVDIAKARRCYVIASKGGHPEAKKVLVDMVLNQEKHARHERTLSDEEFEGMSVQQALPLMKEKAIREAGEWQKTTEFEELAETTKSEIYDRYGVDPKFAEVTDYQPLSLLKRQVETKLEEADVDAQVAKEFSDDAKAEAEKIAAQEYPSANVGDTISINTRRGEVTGQIQNMSDTELRVSGTTVLLRDVPAAERQKLDPDYIRKGRARVMAAEFHGPRASFEEELRTAIEDDIMLDAGYVYHNGNWGTTQQLLQYVVNPELKKATDDIVRSKTSELYRDILERNGFTIVGDRVMSLAERQQLVEQHTAGVNAAVQQIAATLQNAASPDDFTKGINIANQALTHYVLAENRESLMTARVALVEGKAKLTGIIEHKQHLARVRNKPATTTQRSSKPKRPTFSEHKRERKGGRNADRNRDRDRDRDRNKNRLGFD